MRSLCAGFKITSGGGFRRFLSICLRKNLRYDGVRLDDELRGKSSAALSEAKYAFRTVFRSRRNKEEHRYYLLPGMGRSNRRRHAQFVRWAIAVGLIVSALFGLFLYFLNRPGI
ncbi:MAG: hypothetical protein HYY23_13840 [Verrucomicrobia bacterium]|nr:hypothetical protein [Verrucomicrobiota bacterium]